GRGGPHALLWPARLAGPRGPRRTALGRWQRAIEEASRLGTPYELGRAHLELGRPLPIGAQARREHLDRAATVFERLGCASDLAHVRAELDRRPHTATGC